MGGCEFALYQSGGLADGSFTQLAFTVADIEADVAALRARGVVFEDYDFPGLETVDGIAEIDGNYASKGAGERAARFRDSEGNMLGVGPADPLTGSRSRPRHSSPSWSARFSERRRRGRQRGPGRRAAVSRRGRGRAAGEARQA